MDSDNRTDVSLQKRPNTVSDIDKIVEQHDEEGDGMDRDHSRVIMQDNNLL